MFDCSKSSQIHRRQIKINSHEFPNLKQKILQGKINGRSDTYLSYEVSSKQFNVKSFSHAQRRNALILQKTKVLLVETGFLLS